MATYVKGVPALQAGGGGFEFLQLLQSQLDLKGSVRTQGTGQNSILKN